MSQKDPSHKLAPELKWHLHLVSSYKCENKGDVFSFSHEQIKDVLLDAAAEKNTTERPSAWSWQKLDLPRDRTSLIVWQSDKLPAGPQTPADGFPTDGYAWGDPIETTKEQVGDFTLEIQKHRSGFVPRIQHQPPAVMGLEPYTVHARTRYRLLPAAGKDGIDSNIWLVLYRRAERKYTLPVSSPVVQQIALQQFGILESRNRLFDPTRGSRYSVYNRGLDIKQKGFVWASNEHWPEIKAPEAPDDSHSSNNNHIARGSQGMYPGGQQAINSRGGRAPKAQRGPGGQRFERHPAPEGEDEEGRDIMDVLTPREISLTRYRQHTEWMEELFISPYPIHKVKPVSLGLGRTGELAAISRGADFADAPMSVEHEREVQKPSADQYSAYIKQAEDKIAEMKLEMEKEKALHEKRMAKIRKSGALQEAERKLRNAVHLPPQASSKANETAIHASGGKDTDVAMIRQLGDIKNIEKEVEATLGRKIVVVEQVKCINKGGLEEKAPTPPAQQDVTMEGMGEQAPNGAGPALDASTSDSAAAAAPQAQPDPSIALADDDFEMVDKDDLLGDLTMDTETGEGMMPVSNDPVPEDTTALGGDGSADDFGGDFLNLPDDGIGGTPGDDFGTSAFDDAFDNAGTGTGDNGGNSIDQMAQQD